MRVSKKYPETMRSTILYGMAPIIQSPGGYDMNLVVVQCRLNSKRLPNKALYPLGGLPMIVFLLKRLRYGLESKRFTIVLATTRQSQDDAIAEWGRTERVPVVRGDEDDVLRRYILCLERFPSDRVVRVTADNPLTCPKGLQWAVEQMHASSASYVQPKQLPIGTGVDVFSADLLRQLEKEATVADEREHINLFVLRHPERFSSFFPDADSPLNRSHVRMTVDTLDDWRRINSIFEPQDQHPWKIPIDEAVARLDKICL